MERKIVFWGLCIVLIFLPLPLGSVLEWAVFVFEASVMVLLLVYLWGIRKDKSAAVGIEERRYGLPGILKVFIFVFVSFSIIQLLPLPMSVIKLLSPKTFGIYSRISDAGLAGWSENSWHSLSYAPAASLGQFVLIICLGVFGFLVLRTVRSRQEIEIFILVIIACGLFQAFYGMAETFSGHEMIFGLKKRYIGSVSGTYYNRNHFAGFMEMVFPVSLGYVLVKARYFLMEKGLSLRQKILWFGQEKLQWTLLYAMASVFIGMALVFSRSRSGVTIFLVTLILASVAVAGWRDISSARSLEEELYGASHRTRRSGLGKVVRLVTAVIIAVSAWIGLGPVVERFAETDITKEGRRVFYMDTMEAIMDYPLSGTGQGTFGDAYAMYEKVDDKVRLSFAHNDYLEFWAENGLVAGSALIALAAGAVVLIVVHWRRRRENFAKGIGLGCLLGLAALLLHGFTDFNLQIPANAAYFTAIAAVGLNVVRKRGSERRTVSGDRPSGGRSKTWRFLAPAAVLLSSFLILAFSIRDFLAYGYQRAYRQARTSVRSVESGFGTLEHLALKSISFSPRAEFRVVLARLYSEMARVANENGDEEGRDAYCDLAIERYKEAIKANPIDAFCHYEAGMAYLLLNYPLLPYADKAKTYFRESLNLKPADEFLNLNIIFMHMTMWPTLEEGERVFVAGLYRNMMARDGSFAGKLKARWRQAYGRIDQQFEDINSEMLSRSGIPAGG